MNKLFYMYMNVHETQCVYLPDYDIFTRVLSIIQKGALLAGCGSYGTDSSAGKSV